MNSNVRRLTTGQWVTIEKDIGMAFLATFTNNFSDIWQHFRDTFLSPCFFAKRYTGPSHQVYLVTISFDQILILAVFA